MTHSPGSDPEQLAAALEATGAYRVLRRLQPVRSYHAADGTPTKTAVALDVETTGLESGRDAIIQLALVPFEFAPESGAIYGVGAPLTFLEDPGRPIPAEVVALTGITDADVKGKRIDDAAVERFVGPAALIIAHNARFDRGFMERRMPLFKEKPWACSQQDVPWRGAGSRSGALEFLLMKMCGMFYGAHQADHDCVALIHLLATPLEGGTLPMQQLLASARQKSARIWAEGTRMEQNPPLKARRYKWNPGTDGRPKAWYRDVPLAEKDVEVQWLTETVYGGTARNVRVDIIDAKSRYSDRG